MYQISRYVYREDRLTVGTLLIHNRGFWCYERIMGSNCSLSLLHLFQASALLPGMTFEGSAMFLAVGTSFCV